MRLAPGSFSELLVPLDGEERLLLVFLCLLAIVAVILIVSTAIYRIHKNRLDDALKRELLDRGMSAEEIIAIINAQPTKEMARSSTSATSFRSPS